MIRGILEELGYGSATPAEVRDRVGLKGKDAVCF